MLEYAKATIWRLLPSNIWGAAPGQSREERVLNNLLVLRATLMAWYTARHAPIPNGTPDEGARPDKEYGRRL